ncbi:NADH-quinone oxidoreductase subunit J [Pedomonas mirosovicensis]|uniref:NADH-quinone oxidoreductase subunit J n=1 Tax=Pedomonas mirosovicensis TaxID=2908641 RepID=UPI0021696670|nr:NADH-quinone oxidoreductase subunit J [Pedomonas mirosovicensis]MCH8685348.1 NADH-quinone oxidoreductase subunit J [Pedomonas mirosovicensis]
MAHALAFYLFSAIVVVSGLMVITAKNPVHSVLWLILAFFNAAGLFVLLGAEFLAMILVIVYVGAVAVLFLFVVMMLDINFEELRKGFAAYLPIGLLVAAILLTELVLLGGAWSMAPTATEALRAPSPEGVANTQALGALIYTDFIYVFQAAGLILLVAMIGAILLTHRQRSGVRKQDITRQNARRPQDAIALVKRQPGQGIE